jgi:hypothetical protein
MNIFFGINIKSTRYLSKVSFFATRFGCFNKVDLAIVLKNLERLLGLSFGSG